MFTKYLTVELRAAIDVLFPSHVSMGLAACRRPWRPDEPAQFCHRCGASKGPGTETLYGCSFCHNKRFHWDRMTRLSRYDEPVDQWIKAMKFNRQWTWATWFGKQAASRIHANLPDNRLLVTAVPMHPLRRWYRGYNQSELMAKSLARTKGWTYMHLIHRREYTRPQTAVATSQRMNNIRRSFRMAPVDLSGHEIILVDDIKTTGATLSVCARLLRRAGAQSVHCVVAAVAEPWT